MRKRQLFALLLAGVMGAAIVACNKAEAFQAINKTSDGKALSGYDPVAYFVVQNAVQGDPRYEFAWNGAKWLFSSQENLDKFRANPDAYAPQFGGYCAYAVSEGHTADGDPQAWKIVNGKLYLNYNPDVKKKWEEEQDARISKGEKNWIDLQKDKP
jgi:YHS domain-containing protein